MNSHYTLKCTEYTAVIAVLVEISIDCNDIVMVMSNYSNKDLQFIYIRDSL